MSIDLEQSQSSEEHYDHQDMDYYSANEQNDEESNGSGQGTYVMTFIRDVENQFRL